jgi:hypothetical protein
MNTCAECGIETSNKKFCSVSCSNAYNGKLREQLNLNAGAGIACNDCGKVKPPRLFSYAVRGDVNSGRKPYCKACGHKRKETKRRNRTWKDDAVKILLSNSRQRAKRAGIEHTLKREHVVIPDTCPVFGIPLQREDVSTWLHAPSLDRIDNTRGYVPDNVIVVSRRANILKRDATVEELRALANFYERLK